MVSTQCMRFISVFLVGPLFSDYVFSMQVDGVAQSKVCRRWRVVPASVMPTDRLSRAKIAAQEQREAIGMSENAAVSSDAQDALAAFSRDFCLFAITLLQSVTQVDATILNLAIVAETTYLNARIISRIATCAALRAEGAQLHAEHIANTQSRGENRDESIQTMVWVCVEQALAATHTVQVKLEHVQAEALRAQNHAVNALFAIELLDHASLPIAVQTAVRQICQRADDMEYILRETEERLAVAQQAVAAAEQIASK